MSFTTQMIKGVAYAFFDGAAGSYTVTYAVDVTPPVISGVTATPGLNNTATIAWTTDEPSDSRVDYGLSASALTSQATGASSTTAHGVVLTGLAPVDDLLLSSDVGGRCRQHRDIFSLVVHYAGDAVRRDGYDRRGLRRRHDRRPGVHRTDRGRRSDSESDGGI